MRLLLTDVVATAYRFGPKINDKKNDHGCMNAPA